MGRLLVLVVLVVLAVWLLRRAFRKDDPSRAGKEPHKPRGGDELVQCAHCGLHLPRAEARESAGSLYCGDEHARLGRR